jgi:hypothetical protein
MISQSRKRVGLQSCQYLNMTTKRRPVNYENFQISNPALMQPSSPPPLPVRLESSNLPATQPPLPKRDSAAQIAINQSTSIPMNHSKQPTNSSVASSNPDLTPTRSILHSHSTSSADNLHPKRSVNVNFMHTPKRLFANDHMRFESKTHPRMANIGSLEATSLEEFVAYPGLDRARGTLKVRATLVTIRKLSVMFEHLLEILKRKRHQLILVNQQEKKPLIGSNKHLMSWRLCENEMQFWNDYY